MMSLLAHVRKLMGWCDEETADPVLIRSFKRDRSDDVFLCDDDSPAVKRLKQLKKTSFPDMSKDVWESMEKGKNVHYVPIQVEGHPSTSTPIERLRPSNRARTVPIKLVEASERFPTPARKPRMHTPLRPVARTVAVEDDEPEVTWVESKPEETVKKAPKIYIDLENEENECDEQDDVIFVKKVSSPAKAYRLFVHEPEPKECDDDSVKYYRLGRNEADGKGLPKNYSKFKAPPGISKAYKRVSTPLPKWIQPDKISLSPKRNRILNGRSTLSEVFNLDEKRNYQELIKRVAGTTKPIDVRKRTDIFNIADESASFRLTRRDQKRSLNEIKLLERDMKENREAESREYDPITVASLTSSDSEIEIVPSESSSSSVKIEPLNSFRDSFKDRAVTSSDWLSKLDNKYRKKRLETQEKVKEARRESDIIAKVISEQKIAQLEHKLKHALSIPESLFVEPQPTVELPELSPEQEKLVNKALGPGPPGQLLVEKFNLRIHRRDLQTLAGLNWLNDEVINFYMNLLMQRSEEKKDLPKVYATNTFFYPKLMQGGQAGLRRWTRKVDIFAHDLMVVPVHLGVHWCLSLVDFRSKKISYLDSMGAPNQPALTALMQYLKAEHQDKKGQPFDDSGWKTENLRDIPQQMNGCDCGMFACTFAEFSCRDAPYTFTQSHMPYLRRKMTLEILQARLLL